MKKNGKSAEACDRMIASWPKWKQEWAFWYIKHWNEHIGEWD